MKDISQKVNDSLKKKTLNISEKVKKTLILTKKKPVEQIKPTGIIV